MPSEASREYVDLYKQNYCLFFIKRLTNVRFPRTSKRFENSYVTHAVFLEHLLQRGSNLRKNDVSQGGIKEHGAYQKRFEWLLRPS